MTSLFFLSTSRLTNLSRVGDFLEQLTLLLLVQMSTTNLSMSTFFLWICRNIRFRLQQPSPLPRHYERRGPSCASQPEVSMDNISVTSAAVKATVKWFENPAVCGQTLTQVPCHDTVTVVDYIFMQWRKYSLCWITTEKNPPVYLTLFIFLVTSVRNLGFGFGFGLGVRLVLYLHAVKSL